MKKADIEKVSVKVAKAGKVAGIFLRVLWIVIGLGALLAFILVAVKIGQALQVDFSSIFGK
ncbi:MAG: hypothetical protein IJQ66_07395 [Clostridia bacterium]|nr:hypothetical protein [Clostridia bacterium]